MKKGKRKPLQLHRKKRTNVAEMSKEILAFTKHYPKTSGEFSDAFCKGKVLVVFPSVKFSFHCPAAAVVVPIMVRLGSLYGQRCYSAQRRQGTALSLINYLWKAFLHSRYW